MIIFQFVPIRHTSQRLRHFGRCILANVAAIDTLFPEFSGSPETPSVFSRRHGAGPTKWRLGGERPMIHPPKTVARRRNTLLASFFVDRFAFCPQIRICCSFKERRILKSAFGNPLFFPVASKLRGNRSKTSCYFVAWSSRGRAWTDRTDERVF